LSSQGGNGNEVDDGLPVAVSFSRDDEPGKVGGSEGIEKVLKIVIGKDGIILLVSGHWFDVMFDAAIFVNCTCLPDVFCNGVPAYVLALQEVIEVAGRFLLLPRFEIFQSGTIFFPSGCAQRRKVFLNGHVSEIVCLCLSFQDGA